MASLSYQKGGLVIKRGGAGSAKQVKDLQRDLRQLGYLQSGIDGVFGRVTEQSVKSLQYDLLLNDGGSTGSDGNAPIRVLDFNRGRVVQITGMVDQTLAGCISDMLDDPQFPPSAQGRRPPGRK